MLRPPKARWYIVSADVLAVLTSLGLAGIGLYDTAQSPNQQFGPVGLFLVMAGISYASPLWILTRLAPSIHAFGSDPAQREEIAVTPLSPSGIIRSYFRWPVLLSLLPIVCGAIITLSTYFWVNEKHPRGDTAINSAAQITSIFLLGILPTLMALFALLHILMLRFSKNSAPFVLQVIVWAIVAVPGSIMLAGWAANNNGFNRHLLTLGKSALIMAVLGAGLVWQWKQTCRAFKTF